MPWDFIEGRYYGLESSSGRGDPERCYTCDTKLKYLRPYVYPKSKSKYLKIEFAKSVYYCSKCKREEVRLA